MRISQAAHLICWPQYKEANQQNTLERSRWLLLKRPENLAEKQTARMCELLKLNLASIKGYLMREDFQRFWDYQYPDTAEEASFMLSIESSLAPNLT